MSIKTSSYATICEDLRTAIEWLKSCGASVHQTRYERYQLLMDYWSHAYAHASDREGSEAFPDFVTASVEAVSLIRVHKTFLELPRDQAHKLRLRLAKAVNGPYDASMEDSDTNSGRNYFFELATLAHFHAPSNGLFAILDSDFDAGFSFMDRNFFIECKRPHSKRGLPRLIQKAAHQIGKRISGMSPNDKAIIAIDASKLINPKRGIFAARDADELPEAMSRLAQRFIDQNAKHWAELLQHQSSRIICVAVRLTFPATIGREGLLIASNQWGVWPTPHAKEREISLLRTIAERARQLDHRAPPAQSEPAGLKHD